MKQNDLRVIKTERNIQAAFIELIREHPSSKITVAELVQRAEINKGTFYLHYHDIYELYDVMIREQIHEWIISEINFFDLLLTDPASFARQLHDEINISHLQRNVKSLGHINHVLPVIPIFNEELINQIYKTELLEKNQENDLKLHLIISALTEHLLWNPLPEEQLELICHLMEITTKAYFPDHFSGKENHR